MDMTKRETINRIFLTKDKEPVVLVFIPTEYVASKNNSKIFETILYDYLRRHDSKAFSLFSDIMETIYARGSKNNKVATLGIKIETKKGEVSNSIMRDLRSLINFVNFLYCDGFAEFGSVRFYTFTEYTQIFDTKPSQFKNVIADSNIEVALRPKNEPCKCCCNSNKETKKVNNAKFSDDEFFSNEVLDLLNDFYKADDVNASEEEKAELFFNNVHLMNITNRLSERSYNKLPDTTKKLLEGIDEKIMKTILSERLYECIKNIYPNPLEEMEDHQLPYLWYAFIELKILIEGTYDIYEEDCNYSRSIYTDYLLVLYFSFLKRFIDDINIYLEVPKYNAKFLRANLDIILDSYLLSEMSEEVTDNLDYANAKAKNYFINYLKDVTIRKYNANKKYNGEK